MPQASPGRAPALRRSNAISSSPLPSAQGVTRAPSNASSNGFFATSLKRGCHGLTDITVRKVFMLRRLHFLFRSFSSLLLITSPWTPQRPGSTAWPVSAPLCQRVFIQNGPLKMQPHAGRLQLNDRSLELPTFLLPRPCLGPPAG